MRATAIRTAAAVLSLAALACKDKPMDSPGPGAAGYGQTGPATPTPSAPAAPTDTPAPTAAAPSTPAEKPTTAPPPTAKPTTTPTPTTKPAAIPTGPPATASTHAKVGPEKCKACHRVQYDSWAASKHPSKGLDCEGCHGNGADYRSPAVMRDPAKAAAAGLVEPEVSLCRRCHKDASAALLPRAHAHKAR